MEHPWGRHSYWNVVLDVPPSRAPLQSQQYTKKPGGTQLSFWCAARRVANGGLKNGYALKIGAKAKRTEFLEKKMRLKELNFGQIWGFGTEILTKIRL